MQCPNVNEPYFDNTDSDYKISREKLEPEPGFEPRTSGFPARRFEVRIPVLVQVFLLRSYNVKFPKANKLWV